MFVAPNMVRDASGHRRGDSQRLVNPGEVVMDEVQSDCRRMILDLFEKALVNRVNLHMDIRMVRF
jgi:hypothetical protein